MTLRQLDDDLVSLLACRREAANGELDIPIEEIETALVLRTKDLAKKTDSVAAVLLDFSDRRTAIKAELARLKALDKQIEEDEDRLKGIVKDVLLSHPEPAKGPRKLQGTLHTLTLRGNGGVEPVEVSNPNLVPDEFCRVTVKMNLPLWKHVCETFDFVDGAFEAVEEPSKELIRAELSKPCEKCKGFGGFVGLKTAETCPDCGGSGMRGVPGASLLPKGFHIRIG